MKPSICEIFLNANGHCDGVYHSGQKLSGYVLLTFYEKQKINNIVVQILGIGKCEWSEQRRTHRSEEIYLKNEIKIAEAQPNSTMTVSTGIYTYPFEVELPESLPTSCEGKYGFIRYLASVNIVRPNQPVQTQTVPFTVIKTHNLNASPLFQSPTKKQQSVKFFRLLSLTLNNVVIAATVPTSGYVPGQSIPVQIDVNNKSAKNISEFKIELNKVVVYYDTARKQSKKHKSALASVLVDGCPANTSVIHTPEIVVPPAPATDVVASKIIHITYELKIYGHFSGNTLKSLIKLPITIGTVPLYSTYRCVHFEDSVESNHIVPFKYEALVQDYLDLGNATDDKSGQYAPVYPIFTARPSKRRQLSEQSLESAGERSASEQSLSELNDQSSNEWSEWSSNEFDGLIINGDEY